ncbi:MAG: trypsin-like peptidase domain-containing protein [Acidobacteriota bacterium]|nr:trypsin-like peptidase domain-containing protein [Acidobacteriota bacterium]
MFGPDQTVEIGRSSQAAVAVGDRTVGRIHASLQARANGWFLVDRASRNGTWVRGLRVSELLVDRPLTVHLGGPDSPNVLDVRPLPAGAALHPAGSEGETAVLAATDRLDHSGAASRADRPPIELVVRLGSQQRTFPVGQPVRVGRDPELEMVTENPLVTRRQHGVITADPDGATYVDTSSRGTFLKGRRLKAPLRITESVLLHLGDPVTGEELGITPPLSAARIATNQARRRRRRYLMRSSGAVAAAAALVVSLLLTVGRGGGPGGGLAPATLSRAVSATVRLLMGSPSSYAGWGSGTVISPDGLILTNGHVAEPQAPGEAVAQGVPGSTLDPNPPYLTVEMTDGEARPVVARYRARPVAVDGYLDLAVVRIYASADGRPVDPASLHLPWLPIGPSSEVQLDQAVTVLGFPGVSGSDSITITSGAISTFVPDPLHHSSDPRFELETTARVAHGNSGGAAIDNAGRLIGVPSLTIPGEGSDISWRLRSASEALPLVSAAQAGRPYSSTILTAPSGNEQVSAVGIAPAADGACPGGGSVRGGVDAVTIGFAYSGFAPGIDAALLIQMPDGSDVTGQGGSIPQFIVSQASGCETYQLSASDLGAASIPTGRYQVQVLAGPRLNPVDPPTQLVVR